MVGVLAEALPAAFMAALYPPALLVVAYLLGGPRPVRSSLAFLAGAATITVGIGAAVVLFLKGTGFDDSSEHRTIPPAIDVALGGALLVLAVVVARRPRRPPKADANDRKQRSVAGLCLFGAAMYIPSIFYLTALHQIAQGEASGVQTALSLLVIALIVLLFVEVPLLLYVTAPDRTARILGDWNAWLSRNARTIIIVAAAVIGAYLSVSGIVDLFD